MDIGRDRWLGMGAFAGTFAGGLVLRWWRRHKDPSDDQKMPLRLLVTSPTSMAAATGLSRQAAERLDLDGEDVAAQFATGFAVGLALMLLSAPLRRLIPV